MRTVQREHRLASLLIALGMALIASGTMPARAATYYVATDASASDSNPGTQASPWRTIKYSVSRARAGDTVMIKGGNYGNEYIMMDNIDGTAGNRITFQGYDGWPVLGTLPNPRLVENAPSSDPLYWGFRIFKSNYVTLRHLKFTYYYNCIYVELSDHVNVEDVYVEKCGSTGASGTGIFWKYSNYGQILDCTVIDAGGNNVMLAESHYCLIDNLTSLGTLEDEDPFCTDYYCNLRCCHDTIIRNSYAEDQRKCDKGNHGFSIKDMGGDTPKGYNNLIQDCTAIGVGECFAAAHGTYNNTFLRCHGNTVGKDNNISYIINCRNGAHGNTFKEISGTGYHVLIGLSDEAENYYEIKHDNKFINCVLTGTPGQPRSYGAVFRRTNNNTIENCVLDKVDFLARYIQTSTPDTNVSNQFKNCILSGIGATYDPNKDITEFYPMGGTLTPYNGTSGLTVTFTDFWDNGFTALSGAGNMSADPKFADHDNADYHLKSTAGRWNGSGWVNDAESSPCIDKGDQASAYSNEPDPNGGRINIGGYGNTAEASKSPSGETISFPYNNRLCERYPATVYSSNTFLDVGYHASYAKTYRDLIWFDLSDYDNAASISRATLSLYWYFPSEARTNDTIVDIYRPAEGWDHEYASWTVKANGVAWTNPGGDWYDRNGTAQGSTPYASITFSAAQIATNQYYSIDITDLVKEYAGSGRNPGFFIKARDESDNYIAFYGLEFSNVSMRPTLDVRLASDVWVNFSWAGAESGTQTEPYNTLAEGVGAITDGQTLHIQTGSSAEPARIMKPMRIVAENGMVRIGAGAAGSSPTSRRPSAPAGRSSACSWELYH